MAHRKIEHPTYKTCRYFIEGNCKFGNQGIYSHTQVGEGKSLCFKCGNTFDSKDDMMKHIKKDHKSTNICQNYKNKQCRFTNDKCWFTHESTNGQTIPQTEQPMNKDQQDIMNFWQNTVNMAPPINQPTHQILNTIMTMLRQVHTTINPTQV